MDMAPPPAAVAEARGVPLVRISMGVAHSASHTAEVSRLLGDSNDDRIFNSSDLVAVFQAGKYEDATFGEGDWNQDGGFTTADLVFVFQAGHYVAAATPPKGQIASAVDWLFAQNDGAKRSRTFVA